MSTDIVNMESSLVTLSDRFCSIRRFSEDLANPLSIEDCALQSMTDSSPTKWHLAHTTWFFETFILSELPDYQTFNDNYCYLFNSYYNTVGKQFPRSQRGLMSRPGMEEILAYRRYVDDRLMELLAREKDSNGRLAHVVEIGLQHEQQHQELILTDIKHAFSCHPLQPTYRKGTFGQAQPQNSLTWQEYEEGVYWIGHEGSLFSFDNESPRHREFLESFQLQQRLVTCGEYLSFIEEGGYERPEFWLSLGWEKVCQHGWAAPLYWYKRDGQWYEFTLSGSKWLNLSLPVCHVSYFEADAFARWSEVRLPTESEWEVASRDVAFEGNFVDTNWNDGSMIHPGCGEPSTTRPANLFGDVWEWTMSPYMPYPGYVPPSGALGEYNGKFMCNQYVLRGGSCATSSTHIRNTYRNFFPPDSRWQFSGIRLCR